MKKLLLIWLAPIFLYAQFTDDFTTFEGWLGDTAEFSIDSTGLLQLTAPPETGESIIWHPSKALIKGHWELSVRMDFNTSGSNYSKIHLSSDSVANGYFVKVGGVDDEVSLYKITSGQSTKIIDGTDDFLDFSTNNLSIRADRDSIGNWTLSAKRSTDPSYFTQGQAFDDSHLQSDYFGIECVYAKTRCESFFFDNIVVEGYSFKDTFLYPQPKDIVVNEVLFNPIDGDNDFVEILNRSDKTLCIRGLQLANYYADEAANFKVISESYDFIEPQEILVVCKSKETLMKYQPNALEQQIIEIESLPNYNNDDGVVVLALDSVSIDEFHYNESMHFDLLQELDGVSLERISAEASNWHSASEQSGFSTPTLPNSQAQVIEPPNDVMSLSPDVISPNNDGWQDVLAIRLTFKQSGYKGRLIIFDAQGFPIRTLINNELFGTDNFYIWDGLTDRKEAASIGRYILWLEATQSSLPTILEKKTAVVGW
ncbi:MAG: hypothetical protein ISR00_00800 [Flavobacteriales bacterium]|nr:hypothetical protein [Flavobacteriales bacterium]